MALYDQGMRGLIGKGVKINRGGPDAIEGTLMDVRYDHMVINTKNGLVYVKDSHIKSITDTGRTSGVARNLATPIFANTFLGVMEALRFQQIQINRGGPEKLEGVLADANQNQLILTMKNQEIVRIPLYHIKSVSALRSGNSGNNNSSQGNQGQNNQSGGNSQQAANQSRGQQGANQSRGNQSRGQQGANQSRGNQSRGNQQGANQSRGNQSRGQQGAHQSRGNQSRGQQGAHQSRGNQSRGQQGAHQSRGNKSKGSNNKRSYNK
ncbi:hypothetical protein ACFQ3J_08200 [Paenibacillus provencensis]|uniref:Spore coat protein B n=1 Tax=Paenibacillus provencensis TaxID=441151 RepID=A0ABW3PU21_9BACL|nr:hypothetical protein [Paenibacillus sp. MER 78]MCM3129127.1 hypothetical protein [Paenibacillus sp. MER 78]